jgi:hypothetical protein
MKKISTVAVKQEQEYFRAEADDRAGPGRSLELVLPARRSGRSAARAKTDDDSEGDARGVRGHAALPHRAGDRNAFAVDKPFAERVGTRSNRGACPQRAFDRRESQEGRSAGCANAGAAGKDRSTMEVDDKSFAFACQRLAHTKRLNPNLQANSCASSGFTSNWR